MPVTFDLWLGLLRTPLNSQEYFLLLIRSILVLYLLMSHRRHTCHCLSQMLLRQGYFRHYSLDILRALALSYLLILNHFKARVTVDDQSSLLLL